MKMFYSILISVVYLCPFFFVKGVDMPKSGFYSSLHPAFLQLSENFEWDEIERLLPKFGRVFATTFMEADPESQLFEPSSLLKDVLLPIEHEPEFDKILEYLNFASVPTKFKTIGEFNKNLLFRLSRFAAENQRNPGQSEKLENERQLQELTVQLLSYIDFDNLRRDLQDLANKDGGFESLVKFLKSEEMASAYGRLKSSSRIKEFISLLRLDEGFNFDLYSHLLRFSENLLGWDKFGNDWMDFHALKKQWREEDKSKTLDQVESLSTSDETIENEKNTPKVGENEGNNNEEDASSQLKTLVSKLMSFPPRQELKDGMKPREVDQVIDHINELEEYALTRAWIIKILAQQDPDDAHFSKVWTIMEFQRAVLVHEAKLLLKELEYYSSITGKNEFEKEVEKKVENLGRILENLDNEPRQFSSDEETMEAYKAIKEEL